LFGNGGSAADAQHLAAEFVGRFQRERPPLPAIALTTDSSALTAIANDYGFDMIFARQIQALGCRNDVAVAISTSGRSPNVLAGARAAAEIGMSTIGLIGGNGGPLAELVDVPIVALAANTARVQECHIAIGHFLCEAVELAIAANDPRIAAGKVQQSVGDASAGKVRTWNELLPLRKRWKSAGKTVVWTNGCFDLLHAGHLHGLRAARSLGDVLVVGVNGDESVRQLKGPTRPVVPAAERAELLAALECVDAVILFDEATPETALERLKPDIHCKGAEYAPPHGKPIIEAPLVEAYGGRVEFLPMVPSISTSDLIGRIRCELATHARE
jgi:rfaE bifunctional protein nucleotidyltransferase chain/domain